MKQFLVKQLINYKKVVQDFSLSKLSAKDRRQLADSLVELLEVKLLDFILTALTESEQQQFVQLVAQNPGRVGGFLRKHIAGFDEQARLSLESYKRSLQTQFSELRRGMSL